MNWIKDAKSAEDVINAINNGINIDNIMDDGNGPYNFLSYACENGEYEVVKALIENGAVLVNNDLDIGAIQEAAFNGFVEIVDLLIKSGVDVNDTNCTVKYSPLYCAVKEGHIDVVKALIENGAVLVNNDLDMGAIQEAAINGFVEIVDLLIKSGVDINDTNCTFKYSPLYCAVKEGHIDVMEYLLKNGANVDLGCEDDGSDDDTRTPLMIACWYGNIDAVNILIHAGAYLYETNEYDGNTALHYAAYNRVEIVDLLILNGFTMLDVENYHGETPFIIACEWNNTAVIKRLVGLNVDINHENNQGKTGIFYVIDNDEIVEFLSKNGALMPEFEPDY